MTERTFKAIEFLRDWQNISYEEVDTVEDIQVFNVVGTIAQLVSNGYMTLANSYHFISDNLSLSDEVKKRVATVLTNAHDSANVIN